MIKGVLANIHGEGFLHGDVRCENILVEDCHGGPRIKTIDFRFSRKFSSCKESKREMAVLKKMIGFRPVKNPPCIVFFFLFSFSYLLHPNLIFLPLFILCLASIDTSPCTYIRPALPVPGLLT